MAKKVLQFFPHKLLARKGGPYTYLYNLKQQITPNDGVEINFLSDLIKFDEDRPFDPTPSATREVMKNFIPKKWINDRRVRKYLSKEKTDLVGKLKSVDLHQYDVIHFHEAIDLWRCSHSLKDYEGKILFTSHSPIPYHLEMLEEAFHFSRNDISAATYKSLEEIDQSAFATANELVFPCHEALDGYYEWDKFQDLIRNKPTHSLLTGSAQATAATTKQEIFRRYAIPPGSFVISFTARHSAVKGYDLIESAGRSLLAQHKDIFFLVAGKPAGNEKLQHPQWVQTGWTDDPFSIINAADIHLVPNRQTYFDLNVLEAMSLAKTIVLTETGGNRFLKHNIASHGLMFCRPNADDLVMSIQECYHRRKELADWGDENKAAFDSRFTAKLFHRNYLQLYKSL
jgi:glycosyltransferase involved in cell wall biosynthesis